MTDLVQDLAKGRTPGVSSSTLEVSHLGARVRPQAPMPMPTPTPTG